VYFFSAVVKLGERCHSLQHLEATQEVEFADVVGRIVFTLGS
jgi:hypothetical protein